MKKILALFLAVVTVALPVAAQVTNVIKISQLPSANPIGGTELVPIVQSGATVTASVNQITAGATAVANVASNALQVQITSNGNGISGLTGALGQDLILLFNAIGGTNAILYGAITGTNTALLAQLSLTNTTLLNATIASNTAVINALNATNSIIQGEIAALGGGVANGASPDFNIVTVKDLITTSSNLPTLTVTGSVSSPTDLNVDLSKSGVQEVNLSPTGSGVTLELFPKNPADGQNISLVCELPGGYSINLYETLTAPSGYTVVPTRNMSTSGATGYEYSTGVTGTFIVNFQVVGGQIFMSWGEF